MRPLRCVLQHDMANPHVSTHMATKHNNNHVVIPLRSATTDSKTPYNGLHTQTHPKQLEATVIARQKKNVRTTPAAPAAHTSYPSSPAAATLHGKTQGFVLWLPPQHKSHATFIRPLQCMLQHNVVNPHVSPHMATKHDDNRAAITLRSAAASLRHHFPQSPSFVTTLRHHFPKSPRPLATTSRPFVNISLSHHFP